VHQVGYRNPRVLAQYARPWNLAVLTAPIHQSLAVDLARRLTELAPGDLNKVLFAPAAPKRLAWP